MANITLREKPNFLQDLAYEGWLRKTLKLNPNNTILLYSNNSNLRLDTYTNGKDHHVTSLFESEKRNLETTLLKLNNFKSLDLTHIVTAFSDINEINGIHEESGHKYKEFNPYNCGKAFFLHLAAYDKWINEVIKLNPKNTTLFYENNKVARIDANNGNNHYIINLISDQTNSIHSKKRNLENTLLELKEYNSMDLTPILPAFR